MNLARRLIAVSIAAAAAVTIPLFAVAADDPRPVESAPVSGAARAGDGAAAAAAVADPVTGLADLPENQAEREALAAGALKLEQPALPAGADSGAPAPDPALAARRAALDAVMAEQAAQVQVLVDRLPAADSRGALEIQRQIEQVKKAAGRRLLELQLEAATGAGDQPAVAKLESALADWDAPQPVRQPVDRPVPHNQGR